MKYYHIMFIIIVFLLDSDMPSGPPPPHLHVVHWHYFHTSYTDLKLYETAIFDL